MKHEESNELLICDHCGARIALGKYRPLSRTGSPECKEDPRIASSDEADGYLADYRASKRSALSKEPGDG